MFVYEKKLQYPVRIKNTNPKLASLIISQYGGRYNNRLLLRSTHLGNSIDLYTLPCYSYLVVSYISF